MPVARAADAADPALAYVDAHEAPFRERLLSLIKQPSVSPTGEGVRDCAVRLAKMFDEIGCETTEIVETKGNPVVYGEIRGAGKKTLLVYLMYDTQPYDDVALWHYSPLGGTIDEMDLPGGHVKALFSRGAMNSKGPLVIFLNALESLLETRGQLPLSVKLVAEGEEELGSKHLPDFVKENRDRLVGADGSLFPYLIQNASGKAQMWLGCKGIVYVELEVSGKRWGRGPTEFDIHGSYKSIVDSPAWRLVDALSTMTRMNGNEILIPDLIRNVAPPNREDEDLLAKLATTFDPNEAKLMWKLTAYNLPDGDTLSLLRKYMFTSSLNIDGMWSGYIGEGSKTVLPHKATAKVDVRLVPNQDPRDVIPILRKHLDAHGFPDISITPLMDGYYPSKTSLREPVNQALLETYREVGREPEILPLIAGSAPFYWFTEFLKAPVAAGGMGHGGRMHAPDEYIVYEGNPRLAGMGDATKFFIRFLKRFGGG
jgi:acetylornithine deacetylase/succinyl-diaminopimelate desuccinylase-like protein